MGKLDPEVGTSKLGSPKIDISSAEKVVCEKCGGEVFAEALIMRQVSALATGTGQPGIIPVPVFRCVNCDHVNQDFIPLEFR